MIHRILAIGLGYTFIFGFIIFKLFQLQITEHEKWGAMARATHTRQDKVIRERGTILDRNGIVLAHDIRKFTLYVAPPEMGSDKRGHLKLAVDFFRVEDRDYYSLLDHRKWFKLKKGISNQERQSFLNRHRRETQGFHFLPYFERVYPEAPLALETIGLAGGDTETGISGREGLEFQYDHLLDTTPGKIETQVGLKGEGLLFGEKLENLPGGGADLVLTLDALVQETSEIELQRLIDRFNPLSAQIIVMDVFTGEILAMASHSRDHAKNNSEYHPLKFRNRPLLDVFEPGSTMKAFTMGEAIETAKLKPRENFFCPGHIQIYDKVIRCNKVHNQIPAEDVIAFSCNVGAVEVARKFTSREHYQILRRCGFGEVAGLTPADQVGTLLPPSKWSGVSSAFMGIGQEMAVTGLQLVRAYAAIANGGELMVPRLIREIRDGKTKKVLQTTKARVERRIFSPETCQELTQYLQKVVDDGGGKAARDDDYTFAGKTGTAQKASNKGYIEKSYITSFVGFAPVTRPKIAIFVQADEPQGEEHELYGGKVASPVFKSLAKRLLNYYKVLPDRAPNQFPAQSPDSYNHRDPINVVITPKPDEQAFVRIPSATVPLTASEKIMPNLLGLTLKEVLNVLDGTGILELIKKDPEYTGSGKVISQIPRSGAPIVENGFVKVFLSYERE